MKTFREFIFECHQVKEYIPLQELIAEATGRSGPKYNYEVALVNLYNHLIKSGNKANNNGKILRGLVSRGDTEELTDFLAQELNDAKNNEKHPLHFNNAGNEGFTGGKKTDDHRDSYYSELEDQFYTFLNDSQSNLGKKLISQGYAVKRLGDDSIPLSKSGKTAYGKESDTSKADIVFQHPTRPERENYSSLKKASGAVSASAGADETAGNYTVGMRSALQLALKSGKITKEQAKELEIEGNSRIAILKDVMASSKGMSKEQQRDLLPQLDQLRGNVEDLIPGTERETAKAQLSGAGKFQKAIDSFISTGRGGGRKKNPEEVSGTNQRMRLGKGSQKTAEGGQRPVTSTGDIKPPTTGEPSTFASFSKKAAEAEAQQAPAAEEPAPAPIDPAAESEAQAQQAPAAEEPAPAPIDPAAESEAQAELAQAEKAKERAEKIIGPGGKRVLRQYAGAFLANNPDKAQQRSLKISAAQQNIDASTANINSIQQQKADAQAATTPEQPQPSTPEQVPPQEQVPPEQQQQQAPPPEQVPPEQQQQQAPPQEQVPPEQQAAPPEEQQVQPEKKPKKKGKVEPENVEQTTEPVA
jgi:hypothetical protein